MTAPLNPQPQQSPKDAAATCSLNPTAVWSQPHHRERTKRVHSPHASSMRDRLGVGEVHTAQRMPSGTRVSPLSSLVASPPGARAPQPHQAAG